MTDNETPSEATPNDPTTTQGSSQQTPAPGYGQTPGQADTTATKATPGSPQGYYGQQYPTYPAQYPYGTYPPQAYQGQPGQPGQYQQGHYPPGYPAWSPAGQQYGPPYPYAYAGTPPTPAHTLPAPSRRLGASMLWTELILLAIGIATTIQFSRGFTAIVRAAGSLDQARITAAATPALQLQIGMAAFGHMLVAAFAFVALIGAIIAVVQQRGRRAAIWAIIVAVAAPVLHFFVFVSMVAPVVAQYSP